MAAWSESIVSFIVFVIVAVFVGSDSNEPTGFPGIRVARTFEDGLYLAVMILWIPLFLALYRALRQERLAPALFGSVLGIVGLVVLAAGALPHITTLAVSDLVHAPGATINNEAALELWKASYAVFDALLTVGLILATIGVICLGAAMIKNPKFGRGIGWTGVVLGCWPGPRPHRLICGTLIHRRRRSPWLDSSSFVRSQAGKRIDSRDHHRFDFAHTQPPSPLGGC